MKETMARRLARYALTARWDDVPADAKRALRLSVVDAVGCALGAAGAPPVVALRSQASEFGGRALATIIGGGRTSPERVALINSAMVRYLDFNDSFLAPFETCHPSDALGALLAAAEHVGADGSDLSAALAVSYQVQCVLSEVAPVRRHGFDHTVQLTYGVAAGAARLLGLNEAQAASAISIAGTAGIALRVTRTGRLSHWKGLAAPYAAANALQAVYLARAGITGPPEVFEGNKGLMDSISGSFDVDWEREGFGKLRSISLKRFNAEVHSQSVLEAVIELESEHEFAAEDIQSVEVETFDVAWHIIGGGDEGNKKVVATKEEADHSLPYLVAVALLDGEVLPAQFTPERVASPDVQNLLARVIVRPAEDLSRRFPAEQPCRVVVRLRDGRTLSKEKPDYDGYYSRPMSVELARAKFFSIAHLVDESTRQLLFESASQFDGIPSRRFARMLGSFHAMKERKVAS